MAPQHTDRSMNDEMDEESLLLSDRSNGKNYMNLAGAETESETESESDFSLFDYEADPSCFGSVWSKYHNALLTRPLITKSITAFFLMGCADLMAQGIEHVRVSTDHSGIDWSRALRFSIFGLAGAPWSHYYYDFLDRILPPTTNPWTKTTAVKVIIDQFIQAPILLAIIISGLTLMKGENLDGVFDALESSYMSTLIENWKLWIPATIINIAFVKPEVRVLYVNLVFFVWTVYLSMILNVT